MDKARPLDMGLVGFNNDTYKYYFDFAAKYNFDYVLIDDGWYSYHNRNVMDANPALDIPMLCEYAKSKNIKLLLWMVERIICEDVVIQKIIQI